MIKKIFLKVSLSVFVLLLLAAGCRKQTDYDELPLPVAAELHEVFQDNQRSLALSFRTIEEYPCGNFQIIYSYQNEQDQLQIDFKGLHVPGTCATFVGPARGNLILNDLQEGSYPVTLTYNEEQMQALFHVSDEEFVIEKVNSNNNLIVFLDFVVHRVPTNTIWGMVQPLEEEAGQGEDFLSQMSQAGGQALSLEDGHYGFFRISNQVLLLNPYDETLPDNASTFVYSWQGEMSDIEPMMADFAEEYHIQIFSAQGHVFDNQPMDKE